MANVWDYPHFARYLRAMILRITPEPHHTIKSVFVALDDAIANGPCSLMHLVTSVPTRVNHPTAYVARSVANAICKIVTRWSGYDPNCPTVKRPPDQCFNDARDEVRTSERLVLIESQLLDMTQLIECAIEAEGVPVDLDRRDAAVAAYTAGHPDLARNIVVDGPRNPN